MNTEHNKLSDRLIRKYQNRKFYDRETHSYVTLNDIYSFYAEGDKLQIVDATDQDITEQTIMDAILLARKDDKKFRELIFQLGRSK